MAVVPCRCGGESFRPPVLLLLLLLLVDAAPRGLQTTNSPLHASAPCIHENQLNVTGTVSALATTQYFCLYAFGQPAVLSVFGGQILGLELWAPPPLPPYPAFSNASSPSCVVARGTASSNATSLLFSPDDPYYQGNGSTYLVSVVLVFTPGSAAGNSSGFALTWTAASAAAGNNHSDDVPQNSSQNSSAPTPLAPAAAAWPQGNASLPDIATASLLTGYIALLPPVPSAAPFNSSAEGGNALTVAVMAPAAVAYRLLVPSCGAFALWVDLEANTAMPSALLPLAVELYAGYPGAGVVAGELGPGSSSPSATPSTSGSASGSGSASSSASSSASPPPLPGDGGSSVAPSPSLPPSSSASPSPSGSGSSSPGPTPSPLAPVLVARALLAAPSPQQQQSPTLLAPLMVVGPATPGFQGAFSWYTLVLRPSLQLPLNASGAAGGQVVRFRAVADGFPGSLGGSPPAPVPPPPALWGRSPPTPLLVGGGQPLSITLMPPASNAQWVANISFEAVAAAGGCSIVALVLGDGGNEDDSGNSSSGSEGSGTSAVSLFVGPVPLSPRSLRGWLYSSLAQPLFPLTNSSGGGGGGGTSASASPLPTAITYTGAAQPQARFVALVTLLPGDPAWALLSNGSSQQPWYFNLYNGGVGPATVGLRVVLGPLASVSATPSPTRSPSWSRSGSRTPLPTRTPSASASLPPSASASFTPTASASPSLSAPPSSSASPTTVFVGDLAVEGSAVALRGVSLLLRQAYYPAARAPAPHAGGPSGALELWLRVLPVTDAPYVLTVLWGGDNSSSSSAATVAGALSAVRGQLQPLLPSPPPSPVGATYPPLSLRVAALSGVLGACCPSGAPGAPVGLISIRLGQLPPGVSPGNATSVQAGAAALRDPALLWNVTSTAAVTPLPVYPPPTVVDRLLVLPGPLGLLGAPPFSSGKPHYLRLVLAAELTMLLPPALQQPQGGVALSPSLSPSVALNPSVTLPPLVLSVTLHYTDAQGVPLALAGGAGAGGGPSADWGGAPAVAGGTAMGAIGGAAMALALGAWGLVVGRQWRRRAKRRGVHREPEPRRGRADSGASPIVSSSGENISSSGGGGGGGGGGEGPASSDDNSGGAGGMGQSGAPALPSRRVSVGMGGAGARAVSTPYTGSSSSSAAHPAGAPTPSGPVPAGAAAAHASPRGPRGASASGNGGMGRSLPPAPSAPRSASMRGAVAFGADAPEGAPNPGRPPLQQQLAHGAAGGWRAAAAAGRGEPGVGSHGAGPGEPDSGAAAPGAWPPRSSPPSASASAPLGTSPPPAVAPLPQPSPHTAFLPIGSDPSGLRHEIQQMQSSFMAAATEAATTAAAAATAEPGGGPHWDAQAQQPLHQHQQGGGASAWGAVSVAATANGAAAYPQGHPGDPVPHAPPPLPHYSAFRSFAASAAASVAGPVRMWGQRRAAAQELQQQGGASYGPLPEDSAPAAASASASAGPGGPGTLGFGEGASTRHGEAWGDDDGGDGGDETDDDRDWNDDGDADGEGAGAGGGLVAAASGGWGGEDGGPAKRVAFLPAQAHSYAINPVHQASQHQPQQQQVHYGSRHDPAGHAQAQRELLPHYPHPHHAAHPHPGGPAPQRSHIVNPLVAAAAAAHAPHHFPRASGHPTWDAQSALQLPQHLAQDEAGMRQNPVARVQLVPLPFR